MRKSPMSFENRFETRQGRGRTLFDISKTVDSDLYSLYGHPLGVFHDPNFFCDDCSAAADAGMDPHDGINREGEIANYETPWRWSKSAPDSVTSSFKPPRGVRTSRKPPRHVQKVHGPSWTSRGTHPAAVEFVDDHRVKYTAPYSDAQVDRLIALFLEMGQWKV